MKNQKGFTLIELMAVVCIIAIIATISLPVFNHYIEKSKAISGLASLGAYKNDVAKCFMKQDEFDNCNSGNNEVHNYSEGINWVEYVVVDSGVIKAELTASNHFAEQQNILIELVPSAMPYDSAMNWDIYCSDYNEVTGTHLVDTCIGEIVNNQVPPVEPPVEPPVDNCLLGATIGIIDCNIPDPIVNCEQGVTIQDRFSCHINGEFLTDDDIDNITSDWGVDSERDYNDAILDHIGVERTDVLFSDMMLDCGYDISAMSEGGIEYAAYSCLPNFVMFNNIP